ncbi:MAG: hypothetical protein C0401_02160 [Anaerolinea sp.]|nr:hypothetical protein [Anaerolinea sp.]
MPLPIHSTIKVGFSEGDPYGKKSTFDIVLLIARTAAGKSEIIDYLKRTPLEERARLFHIGKFDEMDDFPMLWA